MLWWRRSVVQTCPCQRHASSLYRTDDPDDAIRSQVFPLLRVQHPRRYRGRRYVCDLLRCIGMHTSVYAGTGAVYSFDPVGSYERETCRAAGPAQSLVQPFLDNQVCVPFGGTRRALSSALCCVDLLQEPATCPRHSPSGTFTARSCSRYCH